MPCFLGNNNARSHASDFPFRKHKTAMTNRLEQNCTNPKYIGMAVGLDTGPIMSSHGPERRSTICVFQILGWNSITTLTFGFSARTSMTVRQHHARGPGTSARPHHARGPGTSATSNCRWRSHHQTSSMIFVDGGIHRDKTLVVQLAESCGPCDIPRESHQ